LARHSLATAKAAFCHTLILAFKDNHTAVNCRTNTISKAKEEAKREFNLYLLFRTIRLQLIEYQWLK
jgi:hypothetical protein